LTISYPIVGIDISSTTLDVAILHADNSWKALSVANDKAGAKKLARQLEKLAAKIVVVEATGGYELPIMTALAAEDVAASPRPTPSMPASWPSSASGPGRASRRCRVPARPV
jgi:transposase